MGENKMKNQTETTGSEKNSLAVLPRYHTHGSTNYSGALEYADLLKEQDFKGNAHIATLPELIYLKNQVYEKKLANIPIFSHWVDEAGVPHEESPLKSINLNGIKYKQKTKNDPIFNLFFTTHSIRYTTKNKSGKPILIVVNGEIGPHGVKRSERSGDYGYINRDGVLTKDQESEFQKIIKGHDPLTGKQLEIIDVEDIFRGEEVPVFEKSVVLYNLKSLSHIPKSRIECRGEELLENKVVLQAAGSKERLAKLVDIYSKLTFGHNLNIKHSVYTFLGSDLEYSTNKVFHNGAARALSFSGAEDFNIGDHSLNSSIDTRFLVVENRI